MRKHHLVVGIGAVISVDVIKFCHEIVYHEN
jgi:hypothetical protein